MEEEGLSKIQLLKLGVPLRSYIVVSDERQP